MIFVGLTGGIASGKSTVANLLADRGAHVIDADAIGRGLYEPGGPAFDEVVARFGAEVLTSDGIVDRRALAEVVFSDPSSLADLNSITHPKILESIGREYRSAGDGPGLTILDAALLLEVAGGSRETFDLAAIVVVVADLADQIERMLDGRGMTRTEAESRIGAQSTTEEKMAIADYVVDNRGPIEALIASVEILYRDLDRRFGPFKQVASRR